MKSCKAILVLMVCLSVFMLASCRTAPINNVHNVAIASHASQPLGMDAIQHAILKAGEGLGWSMEPIRPGHIEGTLNVRSHQAVVDITYDASTYNIQYKSSMNLRQSGGKIHRRYNTWIKNLKLAINENLSSSAGYTHQGNTHGGYTQ